MQYNGQTNDSDQTSPSHSNERASSNSISDLSSEIEYNLNSNLTFKSKGLHFCNLNVHHIVPKIDELRISMAHDNCPDIFGLCETFLTDSISDDQIAIDGYDILRKDRSETQKKAGGGVVLYYRKAINCKRRHEIESSKLETLWAEITLPNAKPFLVCTIYCPPSATSEWIDLFEEELSIAQTTDLEIILMGDFSLDFNMNLNKKWCNLIELFDLSLLVTQPTRVTESSSTIIDHIYTTHPENIIESFVPSYSISDHFPICFTRKINNKIRKTVHITSRYRCFKNFNEESFITDLSRDLNHFTLDRSDINDDISVWYSIIQKHLDQHAPYKTNRVKTDKLPEWYNEDIALARRKRDNFKRRKLWSDYKIFRNKTKDLIRKAKRKHFSNTVINSKDTKTIWQHFGKVNNNDTKANSGLPEEIVVDNKRYTQSEDIANKLNEYFSTISDIFKDTDSHHLDTDLTELKHFVDSKVPNDTFFRIPNITSEQVFSIISSLDPSKAIGLGGIGPRIIKTIWHILSPSIAALINKSILTGKFPDKLKLAKVFPIHKNGSKSDPANYRPISILPTISKIFERHVNKHLMAYLNKYSLIHETQLGFLQKHSCQTALVKLIDQWMACIDKGDIIGSLFLDFRKAFDLVNHNILIKKLSVYKICNQSLQWFISYLESRQQTIASGQGMSIRSLIRSGVPQGSILGPILFLLFINDLPLLLKNCHVDFFADDATAHTSNKDIEIINAELQSDFSIAVSWSKQNKLPINYDKTTYMVLGAKKRIKDEYHLVLKADNHTIDKVTKQRLLGIIIDDHLTWTAHIDYLCSTLSAKISLLRQLSAYVPQVIQKLYYQSYILPLLDYGCNTWGTTSSANIERLSKLQKRACCTNNIKSRFFDTIKIHV